MFDPILRELSHFPAAFFAFAFSPSIWGAVLAGSFVGYLVGVLPGLSSVMACAMLLGFVFVLPYQLAFALFMGVYIGSMGAGGITAIMVNIPGTPAAAATCLDGHALAKQGKAREAVGLSIMASFVGSVLATLLMLIFLPTFSSIALKFGDWEIFLFCLFGILVCGSLVGTTPLKGWASGIVGLLLAMIGTEEIRAISRLTFGIPNLMQGVGLVPALIGLFGVSEVLTSLIEKRSFEVVAKPGFALVRLAYLTKHYVNVVRSTLVGIFIGFLPGVGEAVACWFSYDMAKRSSKHKEEFGQGSYEGIIAAEVANNATGPGALIPTLTLGVPGSGTTAIILAALFMIGKRPGPTLLLEFPGFLCELAMLGFMASIGLLLVGLPLSKWVITFLSFPTKALMPVIAGLCVLGAWGTGFTGFSVLIMLIFGVLGSVMKFRGFPVAPMVLGLVIGDIADVSLRRALVQYSMHPLALLWRPIGLVILFFLVLMLYLGARAQPKAQG